MFPLPERRGILPSHSLAKGPLQVWPICGRGEGECAMHPPSTSLSSMAGEAQWILTPEEYAALSAFKGTTEREELSNRYRATGLAQSIGMSLKLYVQDFEAFSLVLLSIFLVFSEFVTLFTLLAFLYITLHYSTLLALFHTLHTLPHSSTLHILHTPLHSFTLSTFSTFFTFLYTLHTH